jgi:hypothetical protein
VEDQRLQIVVWIDQGPKVWECFWLGLIDGPLEVGYVQVGPLEVGHVQVGPCQVGLDQVGPRQVGPGEVSALELGLGQVGPLEVGLAQVYSLPVIGRAVRLYPSLIGTGDCLELFGR